MDLLLGTHNGIRSLVRTCRLAPHVPFSALPPLCYVPTLDQNLFRGEPAITQLDWNFTASHNSSPSVARLVGSDLQSPFGDLHPGHG